MTRACLVVGSGVYSDAALEPLPGAIHDADVIFNCLAVDEFKSYDSDRSFKLINPTLSEVLDALTAILLKDPSPDVFTFFFAGHGVVSAGSFYMCLRDTISNQYSRSALGINQLFSMLNEGQPLQTNIIIDACQSGGLVMDLFQAIKPEILHSHDSPSISLLATADMNQAAAEDDAGGVGTGAVARILTGVSPPGTSMPYLDLVSIGRQVSIEFELRGEAQAPIVWGLNLTGASQFAKNPHGDAAATLTSHEVTKLPAASGISRKLAGRRDALWGLYLGLGQKLSLLRITDEITEASLLLDPRISEVSDFVAGLSYTLPERTSTSGDRFAASQVLAACGASLLGALNNDPHAEIGIVDIARRYVPEVRQQLQSLATDLRRDRNCLFSRQGAGMSELVALPLRLSMIFGYGASLLAIEHFLKDHGAEKDELLFKELLELILEHFEQSIVAVSDSQAAYLGILFYLARTEKLRESVERILSLTIADFCLKKGVVLKADFTGKDAFQWTWQLGTHQEKPTSDYLARPSELLALLLLLTKQYELQDTVDDHLHQFDRQSINVFIPSDIVDMSMRRMERGANVTFTVGAESASGFFTVDEFYSAFERFCVPRIQNMRTGISSAANIGAIFSSLVYSNRVCWHLLV